MGLNQKTTTLIEQSLAESNQTQVLAQAILDKLNTNVPVDNTTLQAKLQAIIDLLADDIPLDTTSIVTAINAVHEDTSALRDRATAIWQAQYTTLEELQYHWDNTKISQLRAILQSILDVLEAQAPMDGASIITAIQAGTAETHEVVARLDYIGDQANLAAVKAAIDALQAHLQAIVNAQGATTGSVLGVQGQLNILNDILAALAALADLAAILEKVENLRHNVDNIWEKFNTLEWWLHNLLDENIDTPTSHIADRLNDVIGRLENVKDLLQDIINGLGLPMAGLTMGELLWQISQQTKALIPPTYDQNPPTVGMTFSSSTGMWYLPMGILPGSDNLLMATWDTVPAGTTYGAGPSNIPQKSMLQATWDGWHIFVESSADNYARSILSMERYFTNEWHALTGNDILSVYVEGHADVRVWLGKQAPSGGGGGDPGATPLQWYFDVAQLNGHECSVTYSAQANSNDAGDAGIYTSLTGGAFVNVQYGMLTAAVSFRALGGGSWLLCDGAQQLAEVTADGVVIGPLANPVRLHAYQPDSNPIGAVIGVSENWSTAFSPL